MSPLPRLWPQLLMAPLLLLISASFICLLLLLLLLVCMLPSCTCLLLLFMLMVSCVHGCMVIRNHGAFFLLAMVVEAVVVTCVPLPTAL